MSKKILIAIDSSENAARAVNFVADTFTSDNHIILLSVVPRVASVCELDGDSLIPTFSIEQKTLCQIEEEKEKAFRQALETARENLQKAGFHENNITVKLSQQKKGVARDIVAEAHESNVDIIVLGRRGLSGFKEFFLGSISQKVIQLCKDKSILLVQ